MEDINYFGCIILDLTMTVLNYCDLLRMILGNYNQQDTDHFVPGDRCWVFRESGSVNDSYLDINSKICIYLFIHTNIMKTSNYYY